MSLDLFNALSFMPDFWQKILQLSIFTLSLYFKYLPQMSEIFDVASIYDYYRENIFGIP